VTDKEGAKDEGVVEIVAGCFDGGKVFGRGDGRLGLRDPTLNLCDAEAGAYLRRALASAPVRRKAVPQLERAVARCPRSS
jgi:hypothetical protein